jgi:hypothetical protein
LEGGGCPAAEEGATLMRQLLGNSSSASRSRESPRSSLRSGPSRGRPRSKGIAPNAVSAGIIGAVFVLGLVIAGRLSDYKEAERAPTEIAAVYAILRQGESMHC